QYPNSFERKKVKISLDVARGGRGRLAVDTTARLDGRDGQENGEGGAFPNARARDANRSAVKLDKMPGDPEPKTQSCVSAGGGGIRLAETFEHVIDELGGNALAGVLDDNLHAAVDALESDLNPASRGCELDGVRKEVPYHLLETRGVSADWTGSGIQGLDQ